MKIIEVYSKGKTTPDRNEDFIFQGENHVAVIDGATDKHGVLIDGDAGGRFIAKAIWTSFAQVPPESSFEEWLEYVTNYLDLIFRKLDWKADQPRPVASAVVYSKFRGEIWRVGDCSYRLNSKNYIGGKKCDDLLSDARAAVLRTALMFGTSEAYLRENDIGRMSIMDRLKTQHTYVNSEDEELGYAVLNGTHIPVGLREKPRRVKPGSLVVLVSDGFEFPGDTLSGTIERQVKSYERDPLRIGLQGSKASTKGVPLDGTQHDDQSYICFST